MITLSSVGIIAFLAIWLLGSVEGVLPPSPQPLTRSVSGAELGRAQHCSINPLKDQRTTGKLKAESGLENIRASAASNDGGRLFHDGSMVNGAPLDAAPAKYGPKQVVPQDSREMPESVGASPRPIPEDAKALQFAVIASAISLPHTVPTGAQLPAAFLDQRELPLPQRRAIDRMANEFIDAVSADIVGSNELAAWNSARASADQKYITLFGHAAYNALHLQAAKEAVREKRAALASQVGP